MGDHGRVRRIDDGDRIGITLAGTEHGMDMDKAVMLAMDILDQVREAGAVDWRRVAADLPDDVLATVAQHFCTEIARRPVAERDRSLAIAKQLWPDLAATLRACGKQIGLNGCAAPVLPSWASQPVVAMAHYSGNKPRTRVQAEEIAHRYGRGGFATLPDLWMFCHDAGPFYEEGLAQYGYLPKTGKQS